MMQNKNDQMNKNLSNKPNFLSRKYGYACTDIFVKM